MDSKTKKEMLKELDDFIRDEIADLPRDVVEMVLALASQDLTKEYVVDQLLPMAWELVT